MSGMWRCFNKIQINGFLYVPLILETLYLSFTKRSYPMTLCKKIYLNLARTCKNNFYENKIKLDWINQFKKKWKYYVITDRGSGGGGGGGRGRPKRPAPPFQRVTWGLGFFKRFAQFIFFPKISMSSIVFQFFKLCALRYHLQFKKLKNTNGGVLLLALACNFTNNNTPPWVLFTFFKL